MFNLLPTYKEIINQGEHLESVLKLLPKKATLFSIAALNAQLDANWTQEKILKFYFRRNKHLLDKTIYRLKSFFKASNSKFELFTELNLNLLLIEVIEHGTDSQYDLTPDEDYLIFKAYLLSIQKYLDIQLNKLKDETNQDGYIFNNLSWPMLIDQFKYTEINFELFHFIRSIVLIDELNKSRYSKYLQNFNTKLKSKAQDYITNLLEISEHKQILEVNGEKTPSFFVKLSEEIEFLNQLSIDIDVVISEELKIDQLVIRKEPLFKVDNLNFLILSRRFLKNKIYTGFIFDFYNNSGISAEIKSFPDFKTYLGKTINEERVFRPLLETIFSGNDNKLFFIEKDGYPDCYLRINNRIFLIEFKDNLFGAKPLKSEKYIDFKNDIDYKFIRNEVGEPKGISQLANQIEYLNTSTYEYDNFIEEKIERKKIEIYPLIVYTDYMYSIPGINSYLKIKFEELKPMSDFKEIFQPIMIELKFFLNNLSVIQTTRFDKILKKYKNEIIKHQKKLAKNTTPQNWMNANHSISHIDLGTTFKISNRKALVEKLLKALNIGF